MWGGRFHYKRTIIGPPAKRHLNGPTLSDFSGDPDQTQCFCNFSGGGEGEGGQDPLNPRMGEQSKCL